MRPLIPLCAALALLGLATGCQSTHPFATPDASWKTHVGQLKHTNSKRTLIGEVVVRQRGPHEFQLDFLKGGSVPLISIRQDATTARAEGLITRGRWQGAPDSAPKPLRPWLALRESFAQSGAGRQGLTLNFPDEQQRFVFQFNR